MKEKHGGTMEEYPETPPWTMFFDGPLYQKYDEFMKNKDFSKILISTKLRLANSTNSGADVVSSTFSTEDDRWEKDQDDPTGSTYQYVTPDYYKRSHEDEKRRTRRTRAFILLGILVMAALAFGTALVIHYFFVPSSEDRNPGNIVNVSFAVNTTDDFPDITETTTEATDDEVLQMLDILSQGGHTHDHDHDHEHILNPDGKIFDETFKPPETTTVAPEDPETTTTPAETTTTSTTTTPGSTESAIYELHLIPDTSSGDITKETKVSPTKPIDVNTTTTLGSKILDSISPKPYTSTMELDHMDFFAMDDLFPTNISSSTTSYDYDFLLDVTEYATTPTSSTPATAKVTVPATTVTKETTTFKDIHTTEEIKTTKDMLNETAEFEKVTVARENVSTSESLPESTTTEHISFSSTLSQPTTTINETTKEFSATESTIGSTVEVSTEPGWLNATTSAETSEPSTEQPLSTEGQSITKTTTDDAKTIETTTDVTAAISSTRKSTVVTTPSNETTDTSSILPSTMSTVISTDNLTMGPPTISETVASSIQTTLTPIHTQMVTTTTHTINSNISHTLVPTTEEHILTTEHSAASWTSTPEDQTLTTIPHTQASTTVSMFPTNNTWTPSTSISTQSLTSSTTKVITSTAEYVSDSTTAHLNTTVYTTTPTTTTLPPDISTITMEEKTTYMYENATLDCSVKHAVRWQSLSIRVDQNWRPLEVTVHPSGLIKWSKSKKSRHDVTYDIKDSADGRGSDISVSLIINKVQCKDAQTFICTLRSAYPEKEAKSKLVVVGKPSDSIKLTMGPSTIEDKALRITASWQGGYPVPWTNMSWIAIDTENKSYNLEEYGQYRDGEIHEDHHFCQTTMERSIVIFPKLHLNGTRIVVKPDIHGKRYFVDKEMEKYLLSVQPGEDKILVIPNDYCGVVEKEKSIAHPYTECSKFVRCLPGDMVVQPCPFGTCFYEEIQECA